jgi:hypothetical protein
VGLAECSPVQKVTDRTFNASPFVLTTAEKRFIVLSRETICTPVLWANVQH